MRKRKIIISEIKSNQAIERLIFDAEFYPKTFRKNQKRN